MPTTYLDQFFQIDPGNPPPRGTSLTTTFKTFTDVDDDGFINPTTGDVLDGLDVTAVWVGDQIQVIMNGSRVWITGTTLYLSDGSSWFTPTDGTILSDATYRRASYVNTSTQLDVTTLGPPCFAAGTPIRTTRGLVPVEEIRVGDHVITRDHGPQPVRWAGRRNVNGLSDHAPIRFEAGAMGNSEPVLLSPQHRVLLEGWQAEMLYGEDEVLVAAKHLVDGVGVTTAPVARISYHHLLFDRHEVIDAAGMAVESFLPGEYILLEDPLLQEEILALFPDVATEAGAARFAPARPIVNASEARAFVVAEPQLRIAA